MSERPLCFAFVSGKGGVGKTVLATNFAWVCSQVAKTALVDLDFQNQGATGLFAPHVSFRSGSALEAIDNPGGIVVEELSPVAERLYFLPAVSWQRPILQKEIAARVNAHDFPSRLNAFLTQLGLTDSIQIVVFDCHGGVDLVSLSAFYTCDHTLMVTEADSVTFAGTLELLTYYETQSDGIDSPPSVAKLSQQRLEAKVDTQIAPSVNFIVNRLPSQYKWKDLQQICQRFLSRRLGIFTSDRSIFCYIPSDELLAQSFGEYPFHVKLAPLSNFSKKVHYMAYRLLHGKYDVSTGYKPLSKFLSNRYMRKVERTVVSNEAKNISDVIKFFAWSATVFALFLIMGIPTGVLLAFYPDLIQISTSRADLYVGILGIGIGLPLMFYGVKAMFGLMHFYRSKHRFRKALFRAVSPKLTL